MEVTRIAPRIWNFTFEELCVCLYLSPGSDTASEQLMAKVLQGWGLYLEVKDTLVWQDCPGSPRVRW